MSATVLAEQRRRCNEVGVDDFVDKPIQLDTLIATLERAAPQGGNLAKRRALLGGASDDDADSVRALETLLQLCGGDDRQRKALLTKYLRSAQMFIAEIRQGLETEDRELIQSRSHRLAGVSATYGAPGVGRAAREVELASQSEDLTELRAPVQRLSERMAAAQTRLSNL